MRLCLLAAILILPIGACHHDAPAVPLTPPELLAGGAAIPYPAALFSQRIEGDVMLYVVVDSTGAVVRDSTRITKSSGHSEFDAAALQAAPRMRFTPAHRGDSAMASPLQVPVRFVLPDSIRRAMHRP